MDIDGELYDMMVDSFIQHTDSRECQTKIMDFLSGRAISLTRLQRTLVFHKDTLTPADAETLNFDIRAIAQILETLADPGMWPFLQEPLQTQCTPMDIEELERQCGTIEELHQHSMQQVPPSFGRERIILHLFSGRRRGGDVQFYFYLDRMAAADDPFVLHVISIDIVINREYGDVTRASACEFWLDAIGSGYIIAMFAGLPCESWSRARAVSVDEDKEFTGMARRGPRIIRDIDQLWGLECVTLRELQRLFVGNALLGLAMIGMIEHPADPSDDPEAAAIWRLPLVKVLIAMPNITLIRFAQGLWCKNAQAHQSVSSCAVLAGSSPAQSAH